MLTQNLPPIGLDCAVDPGDRVSAIDFIHRVNWLLDAWDIDAMVEAFLPDSVTHHTHGVARGKVETRRFSGAVSRQALSLVVDPDDDDGVIVRYHKSSRPPDTTNGFATDRRGPSGRAPHRDAGALYLLRYDGPAAPHRERLADLRTPRRADIDERPLRVPDSSLVTVLRLRFGDPRNPGVDGGGI
jgi:hypothetical protein